MIPPVIVSIFDFRLLIEERELFVMQSAISNQQSAISQVAG